MKKIFLIIITLCVAALSARAGFVEPEKAAQCARGILGMKEMPAPDGSDSRRVSGRDGQDPEYYVFNNPEGGWVIIAADDRVSPVIAYSLEGSFPVDDMPSNVEYWMNDVARSINLVRESEIEASALTKKAWESILRGNTPDSQNKEISTAKWNQTEPYNMLCPIVAGENKHSLVGCVATAMAIVMRHNCWPEHGKGVIGGYTSFIDYETYIPAYSIDDHVYDWDNMPMNDILAGNPEWTDNQKFQVAQLMHDCGVMVDMNYSKETSGTSGKYVADVFKNNMSYSESASRILRAGYSLDEWFAVMRNEIDQNRVVFYAGMGDVGGHAFVCDGYETDGSKLHINWGWGGIADGYYTLDMRVSDDYTFGSNQEAVIGLAPDTTQVQLENVVSLICVQTNGLYGIRPNLSTYMTIGVDFSFDVGYFQNISNNKITCDFKICLEDKDGNVKQEGWYANLSVLANTGKVYKKSTEETALTVAPELTDRFRLYIKTDNDEWKPVPGNHDLLPDVDGIICGVVQDPLIIVPSDCAAGKETDLSLTLGFTHVKSVKWSVNGTVLDGARVTLVQGENAIRADVEYLDGSTGYIFRTLQLE